MSKMVDLDIKDPEVLAFIIEKNERFILWMDFIIALPQQFNNRRIATDERELLIKQNVVLKRALIDMAKGK